VEGVTLRAASYDFFKTRKFDLEDGRYFTENEARAGSAVVIVGHDVAQGLCPGFSAVGKRIKVMGRYMIIIGVFAKEGDSMIGMTTDQQLLMLARRCVEEIFEKDPQLELPENAILNQPVQLPNGGLSWDKIS